MLGNVATVAPLQGMRGHVVFYSQMWLGMFMPVCSLAQYSGQWDPGTKLVLPVALRCALTGSWPVLSRALLICRGI